MAQVDALIPQRYAQAGIHSKVAAPLIIGGNVFGILMAVRREIDGVSSAEVGFLQVLSEQVSLAAYQIKLYQELQKAYNDLRQTQQQVIQQERLRALGQMASGVAHDFNNALASILGFSEILLMRPDNLDDKEKTTRYLQIINTSAKDAANVVSRLREFYRHRGPDEAFLSANLNQLIEQAILLTQPRWKDQALSNGMTITIETNLQPIPLLTCNAAELREVLTNLIFNAVDAIGEKRKGQLAIQSASETITIRTRRENGRVVLEVSDTGIGMTEEVRQRCLEPFFSTKGERGTGLGLSMVFGITQRHGGTIDIESEVGRGTTVIISLPVRTEQQLTASSQEAKVPSRSLHVLVVDDEPLVRELLTEYLVGDGHTVETATNGREGLEKFSAGQFNLVVTDRAMPEMSGDQLAVAIKQISPTTPVVLLTGFGDLMKEAGEHPAGVDAIMRKPITLTEFHEALAKVIRV